MTTEQANEKPYRGWFPASILILSILATALFAPNGNDVAPATTATPITATEDVTPEK